MKNIPGGHNLFVPDQVSIQTTVHSKHNRVHNTPYSVLNTGYIHAAQKRIPSTVYHTQNRVLSTEYVICNADHKVHTTVHNTVYIMLTQYREQTTKNTVFNRGHCTQYRVCPIHSLNKEYTVIQNTQKTIYTNRIKQYHT
jgi:hypothetical protein